MSEAIAHLQTDKILAKIIKKLQKNNKLEGTINLQKMVTDKQAADRPKALILTDFFTDLVSAIMYQQISVKAAKTIFERFLSLLPNNVLTPETVLNLTEDDLLSAGVSKQKRSYLYSLSEKFIDGSVKPANFPSMLDEDIIADLIKIKGIGKWSAQIFLIFSLAREDVFAPDDLGLRRAIQVNYNLDELPTSKEAEKFAERWIPYRSYASLLLWQSLKLDINE